VKEKLSKYITPVRLLTVYFFGYAIWEYIDTQKMINNGHEPGLGGIAFIALGIVGIAALGLDLFLSMILKKRTNWIVQFCLVIIFVFWALAL
jgi:hypothetical protein